MLTCIVLVLINSYTNKLKNENASNSPWIYKVFDESRFSELMRVMRAERTTGDIANIHPGSFTK